MAIQESKRGYANQNIEDLELERERTRNEESFFGWLKDQAKRTVKGRNPIQRSDKNYNAFIIFTILWYIFKIIVSNSWGLGYDIIFLIILFLFFINNEDRTYHKVLLFFAIVLDIFLFTLGPMYFKSFFNKTIMRLYFSNIFVFPVWFFYALIRAKSRTKFSKWLTVFVIFLYAGFIIATTPGTAFGKTTVVLKPGQVNKIKEIFGKSKEFYKSIGTRAWNGIRGINETLNTQMKMATGDYYTGEVEENEKKDLGIYLEDIKAANTEFYRDDIISVWVDLKARTMDDGITINTECYTGEKKNGHADIKGRVYPKEIFQVYDDEDEEIDCRFPKYSLDKGSQKITVETNFNFETLGYLKLYFMQRDRIRSLKSQGKDPLDFYEITDKEPEAKYTNGPIMLGIGSDGHLIGVSNSYTNRISIGITLDNENGNVEEGEGFIKAIGKVIIELPDALELDEGTCNYHFEKYTEDECVKDYMHKNSRILMRCIRENGLDPEEAFDKEGKIKDDIKESISSCVRDECKREFNGYNLYKLNESRKKSSLKNIKDYITFRCRAKIKDINKLLGDMPISIKYIRARTEYNYSLKRSIYVEVKDANQEFGDDFKKNVPTEPDKNLVWVYNTYKEYIDKSNIDKCFFTALIHEESKGNPESEDNGCVGLVHFCPELADKYGLCEDNCEGKDERDNKAKVIAAAAKFFNDFFSEHSNLKKEDKYDIALAGLIIGKDAVDGIIKSIKKEGDISWTDVNAKITAKELKKYKVYKDMSNENIENRIAKLNKARGIIINMKKECEDKEITKSIEKKKDNEFKEEGIEETIEKGKSKNASIDGGWLRAEVKNSYDNLFGSSAEVKVFDKDNNEILSESFHNTNRENEDGDLKFFDDLPLVGFDVSFDENSNVKVGIKYLNEGIKNLALTKGVDEILLKDWLYVEYTGSSIIFKNNKKESICSVKWDSTEKTKECKLGNIAKIVVVNTDRMYNIMHDNEAKIRVEYVKYKKTNAATGEGAEEKEKATESNSETSSPATEEDNLDKEYGNLPI